jgi:outer membrane receptor protein involved in Fe transport
VAKPSLAPGVMPDSELKAIIASGAILADGGVKPDQIQPASLDLRLGKVRTRLQLNVANLLDEDDVVYTAFTSNAAAGGDVPNTFRYQTPRKYSLTATFNF